MSILTTIAIAAVSTVVPGAGIAFAVWKYGKEAVLGGLKTAASWLFLHPMALVAIIAVLFGLWELHGKHKAEAKIPALEQKAANSHLAFMLEKKAFATEKASLDQARGIIDANNRRIDAAHTELEREKAEAAASEAHNAKLAQSTDAEIAALRARAGDKGRKPCTLSDEAKHALEGL